MTVSTTPLILASNSSRRKDFLKELGVSFICIPANVDEWEDPNANPQDLVLHNAQLKAQYIAKEYPNSWILAADTTVSLGSLVLNKPSNMEEAYHMLTMLSNQTHSVYTAVCLKHAQKNVEDSHICQSKVTFFPLTTPMIAQYYQDVNPLDKAGGYSIQAGLGSIVKGYEGSLSNIIGLPMEHIQHLLNKYPITSQS